MRLGLRSVFRAPGAARWLSFGPSRCLLLALFLITGLPAVGDLRQELSDFFYIAVIPKPYLKLAHQLHWRNRYFLSRQIPIEGHKTQTKFLGSLRSRIAIHHDIDQ